MAIGGSDSGGGAGIEADIKTITVLGGHAMTAITAVTAQDTQRIAAIMPVPETLVAHAIGMVVSDIGVDAVKIGMLGGAAMVRAVARALNDCAGDIPLVIDPVLASTSGTALLDREGLDMLIDELLPMAMLVTPNRDEAALLSGMVVDCHEAAIEAGRALCRRGARAVLVKGGHFAGETVIDHLICDADVVVFRNSRVATRHTHGTGCTLAAAIAHGLGSGLDLGAAISHAEVFLRQALNAAPGLGKGHGPLGHARALALDRPLA